MSTIPPSAILSERFQTMVADKTLLGGVFLTYQFDPGFFEQEVLPVFLDLGLSHAPPVRLVQLEDALKSVPAGIAVYYDVNGLAAGATDSAKLDVRRYPVSVRTGVFHPKNVFRLLQDKETKEGVPPAKHLLVACLSANLTRDGWWRNVECCHAELLEENGRNAMRDDVMGFLAKVKRLTASDEEQSTLAAVVQFLKGTEQRGWRKDATDESFHTRFYGGGMTVSEFIWDVTRGDLAGYSLDVISPFFDGAEECRPLQSLVDTLGIPEVRVFLPRTPAGVAACNPAMHASIRSMPAARWGRLTGVLYRLGGREGAADRFVHAKVYRFFRRDRKRETFFIGSPNLTNSAHSGKGNIESGFLCDRMGPAGNESWLTLDEKIPDAFEGEADGEEASTIPGSRLRLVYDWTHHDARGYWDAPDNSPALPLSAAGIALGSVAPLSPRAWTKLEPGLADALRDSLRSTSFLRVDEGGKEPALLLVQETGMAGKPSVLMSLSVADIFRYWALLTVEQRAAFLEARAPAALLAGEDADLFPRSQLLPDKDTFFDRVAGFFHAFTCLERSVRKGLESKNTMAAVYLLFGEKYDSLGALLKKVIGEEQIQDDLDRYVILQCANQMLQELGRDYPEFWAGHRTEVNRLEEVLGATVATRERIIEQNGADMRQFLEWFDEQFLRRAKPLEETP